jgi:predicted acetyltransferase
VHHLVAPTTRLHAAWTEAHGEWGPGSHEDGFGLLETDAVDSLSGFEAWLDRLAAESDQCTYRWITGGNHVLGGIALRHETHPAVELAGHIGFGIRPSARQRGIGTWALGRMLTIARARGMENVVLMCAAHNLGSTRTIERQGGVLATRTGSGSAAVLKYHVRL